MMTKPRGTDGASLLPPSGLSSQSLPILEFQLSTPFYRVHSSGYGPIFYGPGSGRDPTYRFDPLSRSFGVLYIAPKPSAAIIETILRNPQRRIVDYDTVKSKSLSVLTCDETVRLVNATGANLSAMGTTAALFTGPYDPCGAWSDALHDHPESPNGILFPSRHNPAELCIALFDRDGFDLIVEETTPLSDMHDVIGDLLDQHGKSLAGYP